MINYKSSIDGLRGLAVLSVIFFHAKLNYFGGGFLGVDIFFVISGYLITSIILSKLNNKNFTIIDFYIRRIRRIIPMLFFTMLICIPFACIIFIPYKLKDFFESIIFSTIFLSNFLFWFESGYFGDSNFLKPLLHTWSLSIEFQFYLFFPFIFLIFKKNEYQIFIILLILILSFIICIYLSHKYISLNFFFTISRLWELLIGSMIVYLPKRNLNHLIIEIINILAFALIIFSILYFDEYYSLPNYYTLIPCFGTAVILYFSDYKSLINKILSAKILVQLGLISYSAYLIHQPLFSFSRNYFENENLVLKIFLILITFFLSFFTYKFIENVYRNKNQINSKKLLLHTFLVSFLLLFLSSVFIYKDGILKNYGSVKNQIFKINPIEQGKYVRNNFLNNINTLFDIENPKKKVLIIGDSYAQDFTNMIYENQFNQKLQIRTLLTLPECGIYFGDQNIDNFIDKKFINKCKNHRKIKDIETLKAIQMADFIIFAANWRIWDSNLINNSIKNLGIKNHTTTYIIGKKNFGDIKYSKLLNLNEKTLLNYQSKIGSPFLEINNFMSSLLDNSQFINIHKIICPKIHTCKIIINNKLLSHDGSHLTKDGAKILGDLVFNNSKLDILLK